jgi:cell division protein FtsI (penicillin-binding protein 3)
VNLDERAAAVKRLTLLVAAVLLWAAAIFYNLISLQVGQHQHFVKLARKQQEHPVTVQAPRGDIYDRTHHLLAASTPVDSVFVNPLRLGDISMAAGILAPILDLDPILLQRDLQKADDDGYGFIWVKRRISAEESKRLHELKLEWIEFQSESVRQYPDGWVAAHLIGGVYKDEEGFAGVEKSFDKLLRGQPGKDSIVTDVRKRVLDSQTDKPAQPGQPLTLTIDARIQVIAEQEIKAAVEKHSARSGTVIVMDPSNGQIYALANYPSYDPARPPDPGSKDKDKLMNLGVQVPFEPGSIFKVMTLSAALETTDLTPESPINCMGGVLKLPGRVIHEAHGGYGILKFWEVLERSSNIGAIQIGTRVGREKLNEYVRRFGFGAKTGVTLPSEASGRLRKLDKWGTTSLASISMGQEVSATSIQLARACSVIANGGYLVQPQIVLKRGEVDEPTVEPKRIILPKTAVTMRNIMRTVVTGEHGTGRLTVKVPGYSVAGKTGTAQIYDFKARHYTHSYNASFMGFTPIQNPRLVIVVTINGTSGNAGYGGVASGPVFSVVAQESLRILGVPKDVPEEPGKPEVEPAKPEKNVTDDVSIAGLDDTQPNILEDDNDNDETPNPQKPVVAQVGPRVPNFYGKTSREVMALSSRTGVPVIMAGAGIVSYQMPLAGEILLPGQKVKVTLAR